MEYRRVGGSELRVSVVGLGCGSFGGLGAIRRTVGLGENEREARALLDAAHERGINLLDTAYAYGGGASEEWIGAWLRERPGVRDQLVITSKAGADGLSAAHIRAELEESLRRLGTDRLDLYLSHAPDPRTPLEETLAAFDALVRSDKIRYYGLCNVDAAEIATAVKTADTNGWHRPVNVQVGHNLLEPAAPGILEACAEHGIGVTSFSSLAGGWLAGIYQAGGPFPATSRMAVLPKRYAGVERLAAAGAVDALRAEADRRGIALPTLALAWNLADPRISTALIGPSLPEHLTPAIAAAGHALDPAELTAIVDAFREYA